MKKGQKFFIQDNVCTPYKLILSRAHNYLLANGMQEALSLDQADTVIVGTCAAFKSLRDETVDLIDSGEMHRQKSKQNGKDVELVIFGCLPNIEPETTKVYNANQVVRANQWEKIENIIENPDIRLLEVDATNEFRSDKDYRLYDWNKQFVLVQTGCASNCPFCPHKLGIGGLRSLPLDDILKQVKKLTEQGVQTICLTGNDTGSWGSDIGSSYATLVREVLEISNDLHLTQVNPQWVYKYEEDLFILLKDPKIKEFQVCIQTVDEKLLALMGREPVVRKIEPFLKKLRFARPDLILRTDLILGYPTSTEEMDMEAVNFTIGIFDEVAVHGFEKFEKARISRMQVEYHSQEIVDDRLNKAFLIYNKYPRMLVHHGGQVISSLDGIEKPKDMLRAERRTDTKKLNTNVPPCG